MHLDKERTREYIAELPTAIRDKDRRAMLLTLCSFVVNLCYAIYNAFLSITTGAVWCVTMCFYYLVLSSMRSYAVFVGVRTAGVEREDALSAEKRLMRADGILLLLLVPALGGTVILTLNESHVVLHDTIAMITIAAFTFYKIIAAIVNVVKARRWRAKHEVRSSCGAALRTVRGISLADAAMSVLPMQTSMIGSFGAEGALSHFGALTVASGALIGAVILTIAITMLRG